jgi:hypothetical protein
LMQLWQIILIINIKIFPRSPICAVLRRLTFSLLRCPKEFPLCISLLHNTIAHFGTSRPPREPLQICHQVSQACYTLTKLFLLGNWILRGVVSTYDEKNR